MKKLAFVILLSGKFLVPSAESLAQTHLFVKLSSGITQSYPLNEIRSLKFGNSSLIVNPLVSAPVSYNTSAIAEYYFGNSTGIEEVNFPFDLSLSIFPNPASDRMSVQYASQANELIQISLHDATGRIIQNIYKGHHLGRKVYEQALYVPAGLYFCRISSDTKVISKPVVVQ